MEGPPQPPRDVVPQERPTPVYTMPPLSPPGSPDSDGWYLHSYPDEERQIDIMCDYIHRRRYYPQENDDERDTYYTSDEEDKEFDPLTCTDEEERLWQRLRAEGADCLQQKYAEYQAKALGLPYDVTKLIEGYIYHKRQNESLCENTQFIAKHNFVKCAVCGYHRCSRCNTKFIPNEGDPPACSCPEWKLLFKA